MIPENILIAWKVSIRFLNAFYREDHLERELIDKSDTSVALLKVSIEADIDEITECRKNLKKVLRWLKEHKDEIAL